MDRPVIRDGAVVTLERHIVDVGDAATLARSHTGADQHDLGDSVILPGLINAHVHLELSDTARIGDHWDAPLADWLIEVIKNAPPDGDAKRIARAVEIGTRQCAAFGVTTVGDISRQPTLTRSLLKSGPLRVVSFGEIQAMAGRRHLLEGRLVAAVDRTHESEQLRVGVSPHAPYSVEGHAYTQCMRAGLPMATHLAESPDEAEFLASHTGPFQALWDFLNAWDDNVPKFAGGPIRFAKSLGLLDVPAVLAHVNYCDDDELALLAAGQASVVYCPRTHAYFGHPPHRWRDMLAAGINVAVGTDSLASAPDLNVVDDLRLLRRIAPDVPASELWAMATTRAASALQFHDEIGTLTPGKSADMVCFPVPASGDPLDAVLRERVMPKAVWLSLTGDRVPDDLG